MGKFLFVPSHKSIRMTINAHIFTRHRMRSFVLRCMTVYDLLLFSCLSKMTEMQSARCSFDEEWLRAVFDKGNVAKAKLFRLLLLCFCDLQILA
jgi:hypothetical protein